MQLTNSINSLRRSDTYISQLTNHHLFRWWLVTCSAPSHYLNQCWNIVNRTPRNKLPWIFYQKSCIFIQENAFENVVWKMVSIILIPNMLHPLTGTVSTYIHTALMKDTSGQTAWGTALLNTIYYITYNSHRARTVGNHYNTSDSKVYGAAWGPSGADRTQMGPILAPWTLLSRTVHYDRTTSVNNLNMTLDFNPKTTPDS